MKIEVGRRYRTNLLTKLGLRFEVLATNGPVPDRPIVCKSHDPDSHIIYHLAPGDLIPVQTAEEVIREVLARRAHANTPMVDAAPHVAAALRSADLLKEPDSEKEASEC